MTASAGGTAAWIELPEGISAGRFSTRLAQEGALVENAHAFFASPAPPDRFIRMGVSSILLEAIGPGFGAVLAAMPSGARAGAA